MKNAKAFTLIELLVVVLIIGILSAIALPNYQKAVKKTRMAGAEVIARSLRDNIQAFYLENDALPNKLQFTELLDFPGKSCDSSNCKAQNSPSGECICTVGDYVVRQKITSSNTKQLIYAIWAPNGVSSETDPYGAGVYVEESKYGKKPIMSCVSKKNSTTATKVCQVYSSKALGNGDGFEWYEM